MYFIVGWSVPLAITVTSILVDFITEDLVLYGVLEMVGWDQSLQISNCCIHCASGDISHCQHGIFYCSYCIPLSCSSIKLKTGQKHDLLSSV